MNIIAGPCQHEGYEHSLEIASHCKRIANSYGADYFFKASFDKANRTNATSSRGLGIETTLKDFYSLKKAIDVKILTDVHEQEQIDWIEKNYPAAVDVYQIPAFLCRQTDLIQKATATGKIVNIKKGQFLAPWDVEGILTKTKNAAEVWITERGTSFGYNKLVVDFTGILYMLRNYGERVVYDATHSVQEPGGAGLSSGGNSDYVYDMCCAASALGVQDFFLETHPQPETAPSDGANMVRLRDFEKIIKGIMTHKRVA